jgi:hypothetical protein
MAALLASLDVAEGVASGLSKQGLYYVIGVLSLVVAALFWKLLAVQQQRVEDRDKFQERLEALAKEMNAVVSENGKAFWTVQRELMRLEPKRSRAPQLGPEPPSQVKP